MPFGETRTISGTTNISETDFGYTGQRDYSDDFGLMDYQARFYSPALGRFTQPDSVVPEPGNSQAWNRYSYTLNNPVKYSDPSGHFAVVGTLLFAAAAGAAISAGSQVINGMRNENLSFGEACKNIDGKAVIAGAVAGVVGAVVGLIGASTLVGAMAVGAASGVAAGQASRATYNLLDGKNLTEGLGNPSDMLSDAAGGAVGGAIGFAASNYGANAGVSASADDLIESSNPSSTIDDLLCNPENALNHSVDEIASAAEEAGWTTGTLGDGAHQGQGFRAYDGTGNAIMYHPGGGHHGESPYWRISSPENGIARIPIDPFKFIP